MIRFACACGRELQGDEGAAGEPFTCPACGRVNSAPDTHGARPAGLRIAGPASSLVLSDRPPAAANSPRGIAARTPGRGWLSCLAAIASVFVLLSLCAGITSTAASLIPRTICYTMAAVCALWAVLSAVELWTICKDKGRLRAKSWAAFGLLAGLCGVMLYVAAGLAPEPRHSGRREPHVDTGLRQIALAMNTYALNYQQGFPPTAIRSRDGKPLLSWRVAILPFMEEEVLYAEFHLDEPWDSPHNLPLLPRMPKVYADPDEPLPAGLTRFQVYVGPGAAFESTRQVRPEEFTDTTHRTILVVQGAEPVPWTKPIDLPFGPEVVLVRPHDRRGYYHVVGADAILHRLPADTPEETLRALITRNGGEHVEWPPAP